MTYKIIDADSKEYSTHTFRRAADRELDQIIAGSSSVKFDLPANPEKMLLMVVEYSDEGKEKDILSLFGRIVG